MAEAGNSRSCVMMGDSFSSSLVRLSVEFGPQGLSLFNRRYDLKTMIPRFLTVAVRTPPMPYRFLKIAEPYA